MRLCVCGFYVSPFARASWRTGRCEIERERGGKQVGHILSDSKPLEADASHRRQRPQSEAGGMEVGERPQKEKARERERY